VLFAKKPQSDDAGDDHRDEQQFADVPRFLEQHHAEQHASRRSGARPDAVCGADRNFAQRERQEIEADEARNDHADGRFPPFEAVRQLDEGNAADFAESGNQ